MQGILQITDFSKYDVLVERPSAGFPGELSLSKHQGHVGNQRFQVLLNMNREAYVTSKIHGNSIECNRIVDKLVDTVCNQVVPRGRFILGTTVMIGNAMPSTEWVNMEQSSIKEMIHKVLTPIETNPHTINTMDSMATAAASAAASSGFSLEGGGSKPVPMFPSPPVPNNHLDGQKRRRRSSLLRRSNSESMIGLMLDNRKKLAHNAFDPRCGTQEEPTSWRSTTGVGQLNRMDVVFSSTRDALQPSCMTVGNNRLHILCAVRGTQYQQGTMEEQESILDEMMQTVTMFWKGRFLVEIQDGHTELPKSEARDAMQAILSGKPRVKEAQQQNSNPEPTQGFKIDNFSRLSGFGPAASASASTSKATFAPTLPKSLLEDAKKNQNLALKDLKKQMFRTQNASRLKQKLGVTSKKQQDSDMQTNEIPGDSGEALFPLGGSSGDSLFPLGGSTFNKGRPAGTDGVGDSSRGLGYQSRIVQASNTGRRASVRPRESTVFSKVDANVINQLVAELDEADCNDDLDEPLPPSDMNSFGSQFGSNSTLPFPDDGKDTDKKGNAFK